MAENYTLALDGGLTQAVIAHNRAGLEAALDATRRLRPSDPLVSLLGNSLFLAFQATAAAAINEQGMTDDLVDHALAATLGWLMVAGPEHLQPMGATAAQRIERFIKRALIAAEVSLQALETGMPTRGAA